MSDASDRHGAPVEHDACAAHDATAGHGEEVVRLENLTVTFPGATTPAVDGVSLTVRRGEVVAVVGESGSGKSVTARALVGLAGDDARVRADALVITGRDARGFSERAWRRVRGGVIGLVLQDALLSLDPLRPVGSEIAETLAQHQLPGWSRRRQRAERAVELLGQVGVPEPAERAGSHPHELSGGLRQRALIASAIAGEPDLLIADEPTTALDVTVQAQVLRVLAERRDAGTALLLISHDLAVVASLADRVIVMKDGRVVEQGATARVLSDPHHAYTRALVAAVPSADSRGTRLSDPDRSAVPERRIGEEVLVRGEALVKSYPIAGGGVRHALAGVDAELRAGETLGVVGESGSGKSTLARVLLGLIAPDGGSVTRPARRLDVQLVAQDPLGSFDPRYSVGQVITEPLRSADRNGARSSLGARRERVAELLAQVGLDPAIADRSPRTLSGGQRQRVAIARALAPRPSVIVCDEPVSALDVSVQAQVLDLIAEIQAQTGTAVVFISHDLGVIHHVADRVIVMKDGLVVEQGDVHRVFTDPQHAYTRLLLRALPSLGAAA